MIEADRIEASARLFFAAVRENGMMVSGDGRVSEIDAGMLLGLAPGVIRNLRAEGSGPVAFRAPINGSRWSYRLVDLAGWIENRRGRW